MCQKYRFQWIDFVWFLNMICVDNLKPFSHQAINFHKEICFCTFRSMELLQFEKQPLHIYIWMSLEKKESSAVKCRRMKGIEKLFQNRQQPNFTTSLRNHFFSHRNDIFPTIWKGQEIEFFFMFFNNVDESSVIWSCPPSIENLSPPSTTTRRGVDH